MWVSRVVGGRRGGRELRPGELAQAAAGQAGRAQKQHRQTDGLPLPDGKGSLGCQSSPSSLPSPVPYGVPRVAGNVTLITSDTAGRAGRQEGGGRSVYAPANLTNSATVRQFRERTDWWTQNSLHSFQGCCCCCCCLSKRIRNDGGAAGEQSQRESLPDVTSAWQAWPCKPCLERL